MGFYFHIFLFFYFYKMTKRNNTPVYTPKTYFSTNEAAEAIINMHSDGIKAFLFFNPKDTFENNFNKICIKPIAMIIKTKDNRRICEFHQKLMEDFDDAQPVISFTQYPKRKVNKNHKGLQYLSLDLIVKKASDTSHYEFYPCYVFDANNQNLVSKIKENMIPEDNTLEEYELDETTIKDIEFI